MSCKKMTVWALIIGTMVGIGISMKNSSLDYKINCLKRKLNCLNRKINHTLNSMSEENIKKYKQEIINGYENIKNKIDNITIRDIKDKGNELIDNIINSIKDLKEKLITYSM